VDAISYRTLQVSVTTWTLSFSKGNITLDLRSYMSFTSPIKKDKFINKNTPSVCDALPWEETKKKVEGLPLHPSIGEMWRCLFDKDNQIPLHKTMVTVKAGHLIFKKKKERITKKKFCQNMDTTCNKSNVKYSKIKDVKEMLDLIVNNAKKGHCQQKREDPTRNDNTNRNLLESHY
jgi:hypothetical protein